MAKKEKTVTIDNKGEEIPISYSDHLNSSLEAPQLDPTILRIANDYLSGSSVEKLSEEHALGQDQIIDILEKREVKSYVDSVFLTQGYLNRVKRLQIINKVIDEKLLEGFESGVYTKKDLLDWLKLLNDMENTSKPKKEVGVAVQINNNYDSLMKDLLGDKK